MLPPAPPLHRRRGLEPGPHAARAQACPSTSPANAVPMRGQANLRSWVVPRSCLRMCLPYEHAIRSEIFPGIARRPLEYLGGERRGVPPRSGSVPPVTGSFFFESWRSHRLRESTDDAQPLSLLKLLFGAARSSSTSATPSLGRRSVSRRTC